MMIIDEKIINRIKSVLMQLDKLNKKILTKYYVLIRDRKYNPVLTLEHFDDDLTYIRFDSLVENNAYDDDYGESAVKSNLPYYYKMLCLYVHICAILDLIEDIRNRPSDSDVKKSLASKYFTIRSNVFNRFDTAQNVAWEQFNDNDWKVGSLTNENFDFIEAEMRRLMFNANDLYNEIIAKKDLRKVPKELDDYKYMIEYTLSNSAFSEDISAPETKWGDTNRTWFNPSTQEWTKLDILYDESILEDLKKLSAEIEESMYIPPDKLPVTSDAIDSYKTLLQSSQIKTAEQIMQEELNKQQEQELKRLYEAFSLKQISSRTYYSKVNEVMLKYRQGNIIQPVVQNGTKTK